MHSRQVILTPPLNLWSTSINVMQQISAIAKPHTGIPGAISIPAIRISTHIERAGKSA